MGRMSFCAPGIDTNGLTNDGISVCVCGGGVCVNECAYVCVCTFVRWCLCAIICVYKCVCAFHRWSVKAIHSALLLQPPHYSPLSPLNTCSPTAHLQLPGPHAASFCPSVERACPSHQSTALFIFMYRREAKKGPSYCGLYWLSIKRTLSGDSLVIYEVVIKAAGLSYVRTRRRMKAAHTAALIPDTCLSQSG